MKQTHTYTTGRLWGLVRDPLCYQSRFAALRRYKGEILVDAMVQTRGQQTGVQSPSGYGALWGVTAEGNAVATTVSSGNTLKHAVSAPSTEHSTAVPVGGGSGREGLVSPAGAGSPTSASVSIPRGMSTQPLGTPSRI